MEHLNIVQVCTTNDTQYIDNSILHLFILLPEKHQEISGFLYHRELTTDIRSWILKWLTVKKEVSSLSKLYPNTTITVNLHTFMAFKHF